jgi:hypothetical protein
VTARERLGYAVQMTAGSLRGGDWFGYAPLQGDGAATGMLQGPRLATRLRQAPRVFRAALAAARDAD